jgi:hypothetical protein
MKIVHIADVPLMEIVHAREGNLKYHRMLEGRPGDPGNFVLTVSNVGGDYKAPRHKHNFDQFRVRLTGEYDYAADGVMSEGGLGYFPEGTPYGPASDKTGKGGWGLLCQFGGSSGHGFMSHGELSANVTELKKRGTIEKGVYTAYDANGKKYNQDSYEAAWENWAGRRVEYAKPRFAKPVFMDPANFDWRALRDQPGVEAKHMGTFNERNTRIAMLRLQPGASVKLEERGIYFITSGRARCVDQQCIKYSAIWVDEGESGSLVADEITEIIHLGLPDLSDYAKQPRKAESASAPKMAALA